jgi:hypothetical protein
VRPARVDVATAVLDNLGKPHLAAMRAHVTGLNLEQERAAVDAYRTRRRGYGDQGVVDNARHELCPLCCIGALLHRFGVLALALHRASAPRIGLGQEGPAKVVPLPKGLSNPPGRLGAGARR